MAAFGLYTHIRANERRSVALIAGLFVLVYCLAFGLAILWRVWAGLPPEAPATLVGYLLAAARDGIWWAPAATAIAALWAWIGGWIHGGLIDLLTGAKPLAHPRLEAALESLCISRGFPVPRLKVMETDALNAFATGLHERQHAITLTRGLLDTLDERELEAVLAHELTHLRNGDVRLLVRAVMISGIIAFIAELVFRNLRFGDGPRGSSRSKEKKSGGAAAFLAVAIALAFLGLAWFLSLVLRFALLRSREFLADAGAVELTKDPDAMIGALRKIAGRGELEAVPSGIMEMCLDNPRSGFADLFATHPSIEDRIAALVRHAGGRDLVAPEEVEPPKAEPLAPAA
ncbi:MAG TPA: M48 family metallopeptidase [Microvirga sp.]